MQGCEEDVDKNKDVEQQLASRERHCHDQQPTVVHARYVDISMF